MDRLRKFARTVLAHRGGGSGARHDAGRAREVYQSSTMGALMDGVYDGDVSVGQLLEHGDFGLGTFNHLDGEMLVLDGVCYHLRADGSVETADRGDLSPFAAMTWFTPEITEEITAPMTRAEVIALVDDLARSPNLIYAIRITGRFGGIRTRTVRKQEPPYPSLTEAAEGQAETDFTDLEGTLAGYRTPDYEQGISVAGYHMHFIDASHEHGGHCLDFRVEHGTVALGERSELHLSLPTTQQFLEGGRRHRAHGEPHACRPQSGVGPAHASRHDRRRRHRHLRRRLALHLHGPALPRLRAPAPAVLGRPADARGGALPWAMAACLVRPGRQVVSVSGDGGFLFSAQELETATRLGLHFTHVILRDNTYDMVRFQEELKYGRTSGVQLGDYDIAQYAGAFGAHGYRVETEEQFAKVLGEALSREARVQPGITIIDVLVDYTRNTELFAQLHEGVLE